MAQKYYNDLNIENPILKNPLPLKNRLTVRLSPQQKRNLKKKAKEYGYSLSGILREAAFAYFDQETVLPKEILSQANILTVLLRNIGTNINQIARHTNRTKNVTIFNLIKARQLIDNLEDEVSHFLTTSFSHDRKIDESKRKNF